MKGSLPLLESAAVPEYQPSTKRGACRRDPKAGPGTCTYWWEGCPNAEARNCYQLHARLHGASK